MCSSDIVFVLFFLSPRKRNPNRVAAQPENPMASQLTPLPTLPSFWSFKVGLAELSSMWGKTPRLYSSWDIAGSMCCLYGEEQCLPLSTVVEWRAMEMSCGVGLIHFWIVPVQIVHFCCQRVLMGCFWYPLWEASQPTGGVEFLAPFFPVSAGESPVATCSQACFSNSYFHGPEGERAKDVPGLALGLGSVVQPGEALAAPDSLLK